MGVLLYPPSSGVHKPPTGTRLVLGHALNTALVAYWPLGTSATEPDLRGRFPLAASGSPGRAPGHPAGAGFASTYDGVSAKHSHSTVANSCAGVTNATISAWCYRAATNVTVAVGFSEHTNSRFYFLWYSDGNVYFSIEGGSGSFPTIALAGTGWHHIVMAFNGTLASLARVAVYVDGVAQTLTAGGADPGPSLAVAASLGIWEIGHDTSNSLFSTATIEDVGLWTRTLQPQEARLLATRPYVGFAPPVWRHDFVSAAPVVTRVPYDPWPQLGPILAQ